jgi:hypothetical protein
MDAVGGNRVTLYPSLGVSRVWWLLKNSMTTETVRSLTGGTWRQLFFSL